MKTPIAKVVLGVTAMGLCLWAIFSVDTLPVWARLCVATIFMLVVGITAFLSARNEVKEAKNNGS